MAKGTQISLTWHEASGRYRKQIGKQQGRNGSLRPKVWYFGSDRREAESEALRLLGEWERLRAEGWTHWPDLVAGNGQAGPKSVLADGLTVDELRRLYLASEKQRAEAGQIGWSRYNRLKTELDRFCQVIGPRKRLSSIGERELQTAVLHFAGRPVSERTGKPFAVETVRNTLLSGKAMWIYAHESDAIEWDQPRRFNRVFRIRKRQMLTEEERDQEAVGLLEMFSLAEVGQLWKRAEKHPRVRLQILLGLNCGWTAKDIGSLRPSHIKYVEGWYAERGRAKTGAYGRWALWPETMDLLDRLRAKPNEHGLWLLGSKGNPLVHGGKDRRTDALILEWRRVFGAGEKPPRLLRKTGATWIRERYGLEVAQAYLAHAQQSVSERYADRRWEQLDQALRELRESLQI